MRWECEIEDWDLMPAVRMTQRGKWKERAQLYLAHKRDLGELFAYTSRGKIPEFPLSITFRAHVKPKRGAKPDFDNLQKTIMDALKYSGLIPDDNIKYICASDKCAVIENKYRQRLLVRLEKYEGEDIDDC